MPNEAMIQQQIDAARSWQGAYQIGSDIYEEASGEGDALIMRAYERAIALGLNVQSAREQYLVAAQRLARIYNRFRLYQKSLNMLMILEAHQPGIPDWVPLYYAAAAIHTDTLRLWAEHPEMLFKRIDAIDESNAESASRRRFIYLEFMNNVSNMIRSDEHVHIDADAILGKAESLDLRDTSECWDMQVALGLVDPEDVPAEDTDHSTNDEDWTFESNNQPAMTAERSPEFRAQRRYDNVPAQSDTGSYTANDGTFVSSEDRIREIVAMQVGEMYSLQQQMIEQQNLLANQLQVLADGYLKEINDLHAEIRAIAERQEQSEQALDAVQEQENAAVQRSNELELQLMELREQSQELAEQSAQISAQAVAQAAAAQAAAAKATAASATSQDKTPVRRTYEEVYDVQTWIPRRQKILVIGDSQVDPKHLLGKLKNMTFNITKDQIEFMLDYEAVTNYADRIKPYGGKYAGIIVGPTPHSAAGNDGYSSFIERLQREPGYPPTVECRDRSGNLKITKDSIGEAVKALAVKILSQM